MSGLFSPSWYRIADLHPRLRRQAKVSRHNYRGERWYVLQDLGTGRFLRLNPAAYRVVALMDGTRSLDQIWRNACTVQGDEAPTQDEVLQILAQLHQANVLISDRRPDLGEIEERRVRTKTAKIKQYLANPLSLKFPVLDPDRILAAMVRSIPGAAWPWLLSLWGLLVVAGAVGAFYHWNELTHDLTSRAFTPENMLMIALAFPLLKIIHEFGHGLAVKAFGGSCREMGLMLLILMPIPYVDVSQSTGFADKRRRMLVGAAGMMAELAVASVALWLWSWAQPGPAKAFLHEAVILAGVTTLAFNANPLLRFDGYYILSDWLEIPNLGQRANQYVGYLVQRYLFGADRLTPPHLSPNEGRWLVTFSIASFAYRMLVAVGIILLVAGHYFFIGVLLALWAVWSMLLLPLFRNLRHLATNPGLAGHRSRAWLVSACLAGLVLGFVFLQPVPSWTNTEGVVWMPEDARIRSPHPCFAREVLAVSGSRVTAGQKLLACSDPQLEAQIQENRAHSEELQARYIGTSNADRVQAQIVGAELAYVRNQGAVLNARREALTLLSPHDGIFVIESPSDFPGRYLSRGDVVAFVVDPARLSLITLVPQGDVDLVRRRTQRVELRTVGDVWKLIQARIEREVPAATQDLPNLALSLAGGGKIGLDPTAGGGEVRTFAPLFQFELALSESSLPSNLGQRVFVRFVHGDEPLAEQWFRPMRQLFLKRFTV